MKIHGILYTVNILHAHAQYKRINKSTGTLSCTHTETYRHIQHTHTHTHSRMHTHYTQYIYTYVIPCGGPLSVLIEVIIRAKNITKFA